MRVAVVAGFPPDPYGEAHYSGEVFSSLAKQFPDIQILVLAHKNSAVPDYTEVYPNLHVKRVTHPSDRLKSSIDTLLILKDILRFRPHIVHFQGTHTPRYGGLFGEPTTFLIGILRMMDIKTLYTAHSIWLPSELAWLWARKKIKRPLSKWLTWLYGTNLRCISSWSNLLSFVVAGSTSPMVDTYRETYRITSGKIVSEIHPCSYIPVSSESKMQAKKALGVSGYIIAGAIGSIRLDKGYHLILDCADSLLTKFPNLIFIIAGSPIGKEGLHYAEILEQKRLAIPHKNRVVLKIGYLSDNDFSLYMDATDLVIAPFLRMTGPSGPIHHALSRGKPVVTTAFGYNLGLNGVCKLVAPGNTSALGQAIDELLSNPEQMELYRTRSLIYASQHTWEDLARQYMEQYQKLMV